MKKFTFISLLAVLALLMSCTQEGPQGPRGPQGNSGSNGQNGVDGQDGAGSIEAPKVYYFDKQLKQFSPQSYNSSWISYGYIDVYTITDNDLVYAYALLNSDGDAAGDNYWQALPFNEFLDNGQEFVEHSFGVMDVETNDYLKGDLMFWMRRSTGAAPYSNMNSTAIITYKVIIVRGVEGKKAVIPENVNTKDIYELEAYLNIKHER